MTSARTAAIALATGLLTSLLIASCGDDKKETDPQAREAKPTKQVELNRRPEMRGRGTKIPGAELFSAKVELVQGTVKIRERFESTLTGARKGAMLFGGGEIVTGEDGSARVAVRSVGLLTLDANSRLVIPRYTECGAILAGGSVLLEGSRRAPPRQRCYVHTPSAAVWSQRNRALVGVARDGTTLFGAVEGESIHADLLGKPGSLVAGKQLVFSSAGKPGAMTAFEPGEGPVTQSLRPWLAKGAEGPGKTGPSAKKLLDNASRIAKRLELDVERLNELMELNRTASAARKGLDQDDPANAERLAQLTKDLNDQAAEMTDLQVKGILQIGRIIAIVELVRGGTEDGDKARERIAELEQKLEQLATKLPPLFEKRMKTSVKAGQKAKLDPIGLPPKPPK